MANNPWDFSNIILQNQAGNIWGNAMANIGKTAGEDIKKYAEVKHHNAILQGDNEGMLKYMMDSPGVANGLAPEANSLIEKFKKNGGNLGYNDQAKLNGYLNSTIKTDGLIKQRQADTMKLKQAQDAVAEQDRISRTMQTLGAVQSGEASLLPNAIDKYSRMVQDPTTQQALAISRIGSRVTPEMMQRLAEINATNTGKYEVAALKGELAATNAANKAATPYNQQVSAARDAFVAEKKREPNPAEMQQIHSGVVEMNRVPNLGAPPAGHEQYKTPSGGWAMRQIPGAPLSKEQIDENAKKVSQQTLHGVIGGVVDLYKELDALGGVVNPNHSIASNIKARFSASDIGQALGEAQGSQSQSIRQSIENSRSLMMTRLKQATGMSTQQLNSNQELSFYLQAMGDTKKDLFSNLVALDVLDGSFGTGGVLDEAFADNPELLKQIRRKSAAGKKSLTASFDSEITSKPSDKDAIIPQNKPTLPPGWK